MNNREPWIQVSPDYRYRIVVDEECYDDSYIDTWDDLDEEQKAAEKKALWQQINSEGVWGYQIQRRVPAVPKCDHCGQETPEHWVDEDGCWGFVGYDVAKDEALGILKTRI
jgi:hypothetical protein